MEKIINSNTDADGILSQIAQRWPGTLPSPLIAPYFSAVSRLGIAAIPRGCGLTLPGCGNSGAYFRDGHVTVVSTSRSVQSQLWPYIMAVSHAVQRIDRVCG
jgi:hypothetical protein